MDTNKVIIDWAFKQFGKKITPVQLDEICQSKNGALVRKYFLVLASNVVSKEHGIEMTRTCQAHEDQMKAQELHQNISEFQAIKHKEVDLYQRQINSDQNAYLNALFKTLKAMRQRASNFKVQTGNVERLMESVKYIEPLDLTRPDKTKERTCEMSINQLYEAISILVEEINHISFELNECGKSTKMTKQIDLEKNSISVLKNHTCNLKSITSIHKLPRYINLSLDMDLDSVEKYEEQRYALALKQLHKLEQAKKILSEIMQ